MSSNNYVKLNPPKGTRPHPKFNRFNPSSPYLDPDDLTNKKTKILIKIQKSNKRT